MGLIPSIESMGALSHSYVGGTSVLPDTSIKCDICYDGSSKIQLHYIYSVDMIVVHLENQLPICSIIYPMYVTTQGVALVLT